MGADMTDKTIAVWRADDEADRAAHYAIRHRVFTNEQGVLLFTDLDQWDGHEKVVHVLAAQGDCCAGTVRLYPLDDDGRWRGDRLAVLRRFRATTIGAQLVRFATATAAAQGGYEMEASVQLPNVNFFRRLGWTRNGETYSYLGLPHQPMLFDLTKAPPLTWKGPRHAVRLERSIDVSGEVLCPA